MNSTERSIEYRKNNKDKYNAYHRNYWLKIKDKKNKDNIMKQYSLNEEEYNKLREKCFICGYNKTNIIEIHHVDKNHTNNDKSNLIGLCPNCHISLHRKLISI